MKNKNDRKQLALLLLITSALFFVMGFFFPLLETGYRIGPLRLKTDFVYLDSSFSYFFDNGEYFIGLLLLFFTILFPIVKYLFLFITLLGRKMPRQKFLGTILELINKWAMLDVFVVAVLILNMKFDSQIIVSKMQPGTTLFAVSILLMMSASFIARKSLNPGNKDLLNEK